MGMCKPLDEQDRVELEIAVNELQNPPNGMRIVKQGGEGGMVSAYLVDSSITSFQGEGRYSIKFHAYHVEEVKRICKVDGGYRICEDIPSTHSDRIVSSLNGCIAGRVVRSLTVCG